jgi:hypothetical protein
MNIRTLNVAILSLQYGAKSMPNALATRHARSGHVRSNGLNVRRHAQSLDDDAPEAPADAAPAAEGEGTTEVIEVLIG